MNCHIVISRIYITVVGSSEGSVYQPLCPQQDLFNSHCVMSRVYLNICNVRLVLFVARNSRRPGFFDIGTPHIMKVHYRFEIVQGVGVTVCQTFAITVMVILVIEQVCMIRLSNISDQIALQIQRLTRFLNTVYVDNQ